MNERNGIRILPIILGLIAAGVVAARGCQEGPFGRQQIVALSPAEESRLGFQAFREVLAKEDVVESGPLPGVVEDMGNRIARASANERFLRAVGFKGPPDFRWEFRVVRSKQVNAFCLPGGKVVVYTGIIPVAKTEGGLATVMGHEVAHALAHHGAERMAQQQLVTIGQMAAAGSVMDQPPERRNMIMAAIGLGTQFGILLPYSRSHESEADRIGVLLMATAGYDPRASVPFWERMGQAGGGRGVPEFASTHPSSGTRVRDLKGWMDEAIRLYQSTDGPGGERPLPGV